MLDPLSGEFESEQIGSFFSFAKAADEFGVSLIGEARIPKRNQALCETLLKMYERRELNFSFEILVNAMEERNGVWMIDAVDGNELIGMAVVTTPAYPEATALQLVAERQNREDDTDMDEAQKKIAELEAKLMLAEQKNENDEEMRKKDEALEQAQADKAKAEADLTAAQNTIAENNTTIAEKDAAIAERDAAIVVKDARIAELEAQVAELTPFKAQAETLEAEKAAAELSAKQAELTHFADAQGLDPKAETVAKAIENMDYAALIAEVNKNGKPGVKPVVASYAMGGIAAKGEYDDLLEKA